MTVEALARLLILAPGIQLQALSASVTFRRLTTSQFANHQFSAPFARAQQDAARPRGRPGLMEASPRIMRKNVHIGDGSHVPIIAGVWGRAPLFALDPPLSTTEKMTLLYFSFLSFPFISRTSAFGELTLTLMGPQQTGSPSQSAKASQFEIRS